MNNVCAVAVAIAASKFVDVALVVGILAGVEVDGPEVVSVPNKIISGRFFSVDGTDGVRSRASVVYKVMREKLARFNLTGHGVISTFFYESAKAAFQLVCCMIRGSITTHLWYSPSLPNHS